MNYCNLAPENLLFAVEFDGKAEGYEQDLTQFILQTPVIIKSVCCRRNERDCLFTPSCLC